MTRDGERGRRGTELGGEVLRALMDVHADTEHQGAHLPIRGRVGERARDLPPVELDVVRPF